MKKRFWLLLLIPFLFVGVSCSFITPGGNKTTTSTKTKLSTPTIKLSDNNIIIEKITYATSYDVYVNNKFYKNTTNLTFSLAKLEAGEYEIKVAAVGDFSLYLSSDFSNVIKYVNKKEEANENKLATPSLKINYDVISWNRIANALYYQIYIDDDEPIRTTTRSYTIDKREAGDYIIKVKAFSDDKEYADSEFSNTIVYTIDTGKNAKLVAPVISIDGSVISWDMVRNANYYKVYIGNENPIDVTTNSYVIPSKAQGDYIVMVKAFSYSANYSKSDYSNAILYTASTTSEIKLDAPVIGIKDNLLYWDNINNASGYKIYINDEVIEVDNTFYSIEKSNPGKYKVSVVATTNKTGYLDSDKSNEINYVVSEVEATTLIPPRIELKDNVVTWKKVYNSTSYKVFLDDDEVLETKDTSYVITTDVAGMHYIKVMAISNDSRYIDSSFSNVLTYNVESGNTKRLDAPVIKLNGKMLTWDEVSHATGYKVYINTVQVVETSNVSYIIDDSEAGIFEAKVKAVSTNELYSESNYSNIVVYKVEKSEENIKLDAPVIVLYNDVIVWNNINNAAAYKIYIDDEEVSTETAATYQIKLDKSGTYKIKVKAVSNDNIHVDSDYSNVIEFNYDIYTAPELDAPVIQINDNVVSWDDVDFASSYKVYINDEAPITINATSYMIERKESGTYIIKVKAVPDTNNYSESDYSNAIIYKIASETTKKLDTPVLIITGNICTWERVPYAELYEIYIDDELSSSTDKTTYILNINKAGNYKIELKAVTSNYHYLNSDLSKAVLYHYIEPVILNAPAIKLTGKVVSWNSIDNASGYQLVIDSDDQITLTTTSYEINKNVGGAYKIKVKAIGNDNEYLDSNYSNEVTYELVTSLDAPVITLNKNILSWDKVDNADEYMVLYEDATMRIVTETSVIVYELNYPSYHINVIALSNSKYFTQSGLSNSVLYVKQTYIKLDTPVIKIEDNLISWDKIDNATGYKIYVDDKEVAETDELSYNFEADLAGTYKIKVSAISTLDGYTESDKSNEVECIYEKYKEFKDKAYALSRVGEYFETLGTVSRVAPNVSNGGLAFYPTYGTNLTDMSLNTEIEAENISLIASNNTYNSMDKDGNLYLDGTPTGNKLYKHSASVGLYGGNVSDDEDRLIKRINITQPKLLGNYLTGLYAPAGEVIKIEISEADLAKTGGLVVIIGMSSGRNHTNDIENTKTYSRMPKLQNQMSVNSTTAYVGSYFGGPIYIASKVSTTFSVKISGAVEYLCYIDGLTSEDEFNRLCETSAPYLDFEVYDQSIRFSGPRYTTYYSGSPLDYKNARNVMKMWQNFNYTSRSVPHGMNTNAFITMLFDTYIKAGAGALAFVGADYATLPIGWMSGAMNYEGFMKIGGWGAIHEFNHHFQKFGCNGNSNEVSNNVMNFIEYILYTRITEYRDYTNISHGAGLNSHGDIEYLDRYRDPDDTGAYIKLNTEQGYAMLVENFGPELMLEVFRHQKGVTTVDVFYKSMTEVIKMDFEFFFKTLWHLDVSDVVVNECKAYNYPTYVPIGSFYSSSFNFKAINNESMHALPYICNKELIIDLGADINTVSGYSVEILEVMNPGVGSITRMSGNVYKYKTDKAEVDSFKVRVLVKNDSGFSEEVTITYDLNPINQGIEVTTYKYEDLNSLYSMIDDAYQADFIGYTSVSTKYQTTQNVTGVALNTIVMASGKFMIEEDGTYFVCYKGGRGSSLLYASLNNPDNYIKIGSIAINQSGYMTTALAHYEMNLHKGDVIYYKEYLRPTSANAWLEIGIGKKGEAISKVNDSLFRGVDGDFDYTPNYELPNYNVTGKPYEIKSVVSYKMLNITSPNFTPWDNLESFSLDKVFDGDSLTYAHSQRNITINDNNSIDLIISCQEKMRFNAITFIGSSKGMVPTKFDLKFKDGNDYVLYDKEYKTTVSGNKMTILFNETIEADSFMMHVTRTSGQYLAINDIEIYEYYSFNTVMLDELSYYGNVSISYELSVYGHTYKLSKDSYLEYEFTDAVVLGLKIESDNYQVFIDDEEVMLNDAVYDAGTHGIYEIGREGVHKLKILVNDGDIKLFDVLNLA